MFSHHHNILIVAKYRTVATMMTVSAIVLISVSLRVVSSVCHHRGNAMHALPLVIDQRASLLLEVTGTHYIFL